MRLARAVAVCIAGLAAGGLLSGCGESKTPSGGASTTASSTPTAVTLANEVNLRASDVPGFAGRLQRDRPAGAPSGEKCAGDERPIGLLSQRFVRGGTRLLPAEAVSSSVYVMASEAAAARELALLGSPRERNCIRKSLKYARVIGVVALASLLRPLRIVGIRQIKDVAFTPLGVSGTSRVYVDDAAFAVGRVFVDLVAVGSPAAFPLASERRLLAVLYTRAKAHRP